jgi:hypothetical protein
VTQASNPIGSITLDTAASIDLLVSALPVLLNENAKVSVFLCHRSPSVRFEVVQIHVQLRLSPLLSRKGLPHLS